MKKIITLMLTLAVAAAAVLAGAGLPSFAAEQAAEIIYSQDFEKFEPSSGTGEDAVFNDSKGNKPAGMEEYVGDAPKSGGLIVSGQVGGTKSLRLMRYENGVANIRASGFSTRSAGDGAKVTVSMSFRYKVLGNYGFTALLCGITASPNLDDYGNETRNIFAVKTDVNTGKDSIFIANPDGSANRILVADTLTADADHVLAAVFTLGSDEYEIILDGRSLGNFKYIAPMTGITGLRIDCHDWAAECEMSKAQPGDVHVNELYFDDLLITAEGGSARTDADADYKFRGSDDMFIEDWEFLLAEEDFIQPSEDSEQFMYNGGLPFLKSEKTPFINPASFVKLFENESSSDGISLGLKDFADMRFWNINFPVESGDAAYAWFDFNVRSLTGYFDFCVTNTGEVQNGPTDSTGQGGMVLCVRKAPSGKIELMNSNSQRICELETDRVYQLGVVFTEGSDSYYIFVDGKYAADSISAYPAEFAGIASLRFDLDGAGSVVEIDNITLELGTLSKVTPGEEEPTAVPTEEPATEAPATEAPATEAPATQEPATEAPKATDVPAQTEGAETASPSAATPGGNSSGGGKTNPAPFIIIGVVAAAAVAAGAILIARKRK